MNIPRNLIDKLHARKEQGALRSLKIWDSLKTDFFSNDYLGYAREKRPLFFRGSSGSRLISGTRKQHLDVEKYLANFHKGEASLLFNSGYDANIGFFSCIPQKGDIVLYDELIHASVRDGLRLSQAKTYRFKHNDMMDLEKKIQRFNAAKIIYIVIESVYSMDGDSPDFQQLKTLVWQYKIYLIIDEAHSLGVYGKNGEGLAISQGIYEDCFARLYTFGKALGCHGAVWVGSPQLIIYLINFARSFIYTTALSSSMAKEIERRYQRLSKEHYARERLKQNIIAYKKIVQAKKSATSFSLNDSPIQSYFGKTKEELIAIAHQLQKEGFAVKPIFSPTVSFGKERLRISLHSFNTFSEIEKLISLIDSQGEI